MSADLKAVPGKLARVVGQPAALAIVDRFGGRHLYVPRKPRGDHRLAELLSPEQFAALSKAMGGQSIELPETAVSPSQKKEAIMELSGSGLSHGAIAKRVGCSRRYVYVVLRSLQEAS